MLDNLVLSAPVAAALRLAATERPGGGYPLTTGRVLAALMRVDATNDWQRIWLHTGDLLSQGIADEPDAPDVPGSAGLGSAGGEPEKWQGVPLTDSLADALRLLEQICDAYWLVPVPGGALAFALLADPANGAARAMLRSGTVGHAELLSLVQSELLGGTLEDVGSLIAEHQVPSRQLLVPGRQMAGPSNGRLITPGALKRPADHSNDAAWMAAATASSTGRWAGCSEARRWRLLSAVALALIAIGLFWHRQFLPPPTVMVLPPYPVPAVASQVLTTAELPAAPASSGGWLAMQDGPPTDGVFVGSGRFRADLRHELFVGAWQRSWISVNGQNGVQVAAYETRARAGAVSFLPSQCRPQQQVRLPGATVAGYVSSAPLAAEACAAGLRGRTVVAVTVWADGPGASGFAWRAVRAGMSKQLLRVPNAAKDLPPVSVLSSPTRIAILSTLMGVVLGIPLLLGVITMVRDRSTWRRLRTRLSVSGLFLKALGSGRTMHAFPVDRMVNVRLARHAALVLARLAVITWTMRATEVWRFGTLQTGGALAAAIAAMLAAEWLVRRRRPAPWRPAIFTGSRWIIGAASLLVSAALAGAGVFLLVESAMVSALGVVPGWSDYRAAQLGRTGEIAGVFLILGALLPFTLARRLGMRALRNQAAKQHPGDEERHPVLMLRSFADDRRLLRARRFDRASIVERLAMRRFERFDEVAASALAVYGPVLTVSPPKEKLPPPLGAERRSFSNEDWKDRIRELVSSARLICVTVGRSESLLWEISEIRAAGALNRVIFLLPPTGKPEQRRRLEVLAFALGISYALLDQTRADRDVLAVIFPNVGPDGGIPVVITGAAQDDVGYESAIGTWALALTGDRRKFPLDLQEMSAELTCYEASGAAESAAERARSVTESDTGQRDPKRLIYPPGKAPVYKPWSRRMLGKRMLGWTLSVLIIPGALKLLGGNSVPTQTVTANYNVGGLVQDIRSQAVYAVLGGHLIQPLDFKNPNSRPGTVVNDFINGLVVDGASAYYTSGTVGHVGRVDLNSRRLLWTRKVAVGVQSAVLADNRVIVTSPATGALEELSAADGHLIKRRKMAGTPYWVAAAGGRLYVSLARRSEVAELDPETLQTVAVVKVPSGPRDIYVQGSQLWVQCDLAHQLVAFSTTRTPLRAAHTLWDSVQEGIISSAAGWLSIQGQEWVSLVSPDDILTRIPLGLPNITSMVVQPDGSVIVGYGDGHIDKLGPVKP